MAVKRKLTPAQRRRAAERRMTRAQARTNKRLREAGETYIHSSGAKLKRSGKHSYEDAHGKYARAGDTITTSSRTRPSYASLQRGKESKLVGPQSAITLGGPRKPRKKLEWPAKKKAAPVKKKLTPTERRRAAEKKMLRAEIKTKRRLGAKPPSAKKPSERASTGEKVFKKATSATQSITMRTIRGGMQKVAAKKKTALRKPSSKQFAGTSAFGMMFSKKRGGAAKKKAKKMRSHDAKAIQNRLKQETGTEYGFKRGIKRKRSK